MQKNEGGSNKVCVDAWEKYIEIIPKEERGNVLQAYHNRLTSDDQAVREQAAAVSTCSR
jgi:proline iminopeptidase